MEKQIVKIVIDRPKGFVDLFENVYPINYGYVPNVFGGDGEEQDVYIISETIFDVMSEFTGEIIAIIHRNDDIEEKWVATAPGELLSEAQIWQHINFLEKYFDSWLEML